MLIKAATMLYVENTTQVMEFWTQKMDFVVLSAGEYEGDPIFEIAQTKDSGAKFGIYNKQIVADSHEDMVVTYPSLMFDVENLEEKHKEMTVKGINVTPIVEYNGMLHFSFSDTEGNYMAIRSLEK